MPLNQQCGRSSLAEALEDRRRCAGRTWYANRPGRRFAKTADSRTILLEMFVNGINLVTNGPSGIWSCSSIRI